MFIYSRYIFVFQLSRVTQKKGTSNKVSFEIFRKLSFQWTTFQLSHFDSLHLKHEPPCTFKGFWSVSVVTFGCDPQSNHLLWTTISFTYYLVQSPSPVLRKMKKLGSPILNSGSSQNSYGLVYGPTQTPTPTSRGSETITYFQLLWILTWHHNAAMHDQNQSYKFKQLVPIDCKSTMIILLIQTTVYINSCWAGFRTLVCPYFCWRLRKIL